MDAEKPDYPKKISTCDAWVNFTDLEVSAGGLLPCNSPGWADFAWCRLVYARRTGNAAFVEMGTCAVTGETKLEGNKN